MKNVAKLKASTFSTLTFPHDIPPENGGVMTVAPGLLWVRLPLPFQLNHINVWLIEDGDGWFLIDTGCNTEEINRAWENLFSGVMENKPITRLAVTHGHVDHVGLAGKITSRFGAHYVGTFGEWVWARIAHTKDFPGSNMALHDFLLGHGFEDAQVRNMVQTRSHFIDLSTPVPPAISEIRDGDTIEIAGRPWQILVTKGHAFEHSSFYDPAENVIIVGDHLLPNISPVIAVDEMIPGADPLKDFLESFSRFSDIPSDTLVLPSHGLPYRGIHQRINELRQHHEKRLEATVKQLDKPLTARELAKAMFPRVEGTIGISFALAETLAHVNYLLNQEVIKEDVNASGHYVYMDKS
jgi:glyoxylase-like metal-dependent hydrolase (beta-lactamase superfamily II)